MKLKYIEEFEFRTAGRWISRGSEIHRFQPGVGLASVIILLPRLKQEESTIA